VPLDQDFCANGLQNGSEICGHLMNRKAIIPIQVTAEIREMKECKKAKRCTAMAKFPNFPEKQLKSRERSEAFLMTKYKHYLKTLTEKELLEIEQF
jgi:hypothetical protein